MANLKHITEVPEVEALKGTEKVLLNVDGSARQVAVNAVQADWAVEDENNPAFIKNKPAATKELMYEWNFSANDEVYEIYENVDEDLSWLTTKSDDVDFEIVVEQYCVTHDEDGNRMIMPNTTMWCNQFHGYAAYLTNLPTGERNILITNSYSSEWNINSYPNLCCVYVNIVDGIHFDIDSGEFTPTPVDAGGFVFFGDDHGLPFKSVKIYKVIR